MAKGPTTGAISNVRLGALLVAIGCLPADAQGRSVFISESDWLMEPLMLACGLILLLCIAFFLWSRERRLRRQRERLRSTYNLGDEILSASSPEAILNRVSASLTAVLGVTRVHIYVYNRSAKTLDPLSADGSERRRHPAARKPAPSPASTTAPCW